MSVAVAVAVSAAAAAAAAAVVVVVVLEFIPECLFEPPRTRCEIAERRLDRLPSSILSRSSFQKPPLPGSFLERGSFTKHLFNERLCRIEFCFDEKREKLLLSALNFWCKSGRIKRYNFYFNIKIVK